MLDHVHMTTAPESIADGPSPAARARVMQLLEAEREEIEEVLFFPGELTPFNPRDPQTVFSQGWNDDE
jgi:hypothetical protein